MMRRRLVAIAMIAVVLVAVVEPLFARSVTGIHRGMRRMVGYTIVGTATLRELREGRDGKYAILDDGSVFKLNDLSLALPLSDVVIFAKAVSPDLRARYKELPERFFYSYKLLLDDEIVDVDPK